MNNDMFDYVPRMMESWNKIRESFGFPKQEFHETRDGRILAFSMPSVNVGKSCPQNVKEIASTAFDMEVSKFIRGRKLNEKREIFCLLLHAGMKAIHKNGTIKISLNHNEVSRIFIQVVEAGVKSKFWRLVLAKPGSAKSSRLLPNEKLRNLLPSTNIYDIWTPPTFFIKNRRWKDIDKTEREILNVDRTNKIVIETQKMLEKINEINNDNSKPPISYLYQHDNIVELAHLIIGIKEPTIVHSYQTAIFQGDYHLGGRIYSGQFGHTNITKKNRKGLVFGNIPAVELDLKAMFTRLLYHLIGKDFAGDPYEYVWGGTASRDQRDLAKLAMNTLIHADSRESAIKSLNFASSKWAKQKAGEKNRREKEGASAVKAYKLRQKLWRVKKKFAEIVEMAELAHKDIQPYFHKNDIGNILQRIESAVIIQVLYELASYDIQSFSLHDCVVVPKPAVNLAEQLINAIYYKIVGYYPRIEISEENLPVEPPYAIYPLYEQKSVKIGIIYNLLQLNN